VLRYVYRSLAPSRAELQSWNVTPFVPTGLSARSEYAHNRCGYSYPQPDQASIIAKKLTALQVFTLYVARETAPKERGSRHTRLHAEKRG
jgi:hypothetical protein